MKLVSFLKEFSIDVTFVGGCATVAFGTYQIYQPAGWIVAGLLAVLIAYLANK